MAVPKKKTSPSRRGLRRAGQHHKLYAKHPSTCPNCGNARLSHSICPSCGYYKNKEIIHIPVPSEEGEEKSAP